MGQKYCKINKFQSKNCKISLKISKIRTFQEFFACNAYLDHIKIFRDYVAYRHCRHHKRVYTGSLIIFPKIQIQKFKFAAVQNVCRDLSKSLYIEWLKSKKTKFFDFLFSNLLNHKGKKRQQLEYNLFTEFITFFVR